MINLTEIMKKRAKNMKENDQRRKIKSKAKYLQIERAHWVSIPRNIWNNASTNFQMPENKNRFRHKINGVSECYKNGGRLPNSFVGR